jgi:hypothetical protein
MPRGQWLAREGGAALQLHHHRQTLRTAETRRLLFTRQNLRPTTQIRRPALTAPGAINEYRNSLPRANPSKGGGAKLPV